MVHFQHPAVRQLIAAAELGDERFADDLLFEPGEELFVDLPLDLLPGQPAAGLEAEDILRLAAGQGFLPDANRGPDADIALPHGKFFF